MSEITEHELQALEMKKDEVIHAAGQEISRLKLLLSDLISKAEPFVGALKTYERNDTRDRDALARAFTFGDLRSLSEAVRKAKETVKLGKGE